MRRVKITAPPKTECTFCASGFGMNLSCPEHGAKTAVKLFELTIRVGASTKGVTPGILAHAVKSALEEAGMSVPELGCVEVV